MKNRLLGVAIVLVALAIAVNALALATASVTNKMTIPVVSTTAALLAFSAPGTPDADITVSTATDQLVLSVNTGVQKDSTYVFTPVFVITKNSASDVTLGYDVSAFTALGLTVTLMNAANDSDLSTVTLTSLSPTVTVKMQVVAGSGAALSNTQADLIVTATKL